MASSGFWAPRLHQNHASSHSRGDAHSPRVPDHSFQLLCEYSRIASPMKLIDRVHGDYVASRRARVLSDHLAKIIPDRFLMLDVGCGDGLIARLINERRADIHLRGLDVL